MKYIAIIDEEMLSNFRIDEPPYYMSEDDKILVVKDELGYTRGIQLKPLPKHGRLIDADALDKDCESSEYHEAITSWLDLAPTIIEEESEE